MRYSPDKTLKVKVTTARSNQGHTMTLRTNPPQTNVPTKFQLPSMGENNTPTVLNGCGVKMKRAAYPTMATLK